METVTKEDPRPSRISHEVAGLRWLADAGPGSARVVPVLDSGPTWLREPRLRRSSPSPEAAEEFGRGLAFTHAAGAPHFGAPPPGHEGQGWMGGARLPLLEEGAAASWGEFYARHRILPYLASPGFTAQERHDLGLLCEKLGGGVFDHEQPLLVREGGAAARTHGDLWSGNLLWTPEGAVLIDPAAQGGHAEEDLAALAVFGCPMLERILDAYEEASPPAEGWRERIGLHQLHILCVHVHLFGSAYAPDVMRIVRRFI